MKAKQKKERSILSVKKAVKKKIGFIICPLGGRCWNPICAIGGCVQ